MFPWPFDQHSALYYANYPQILLLVHVLIGHNQSSSTQNIDLHLVPRMSFTLWYGIELYNGGIVYCYDYYCGEKLTIQIIYSVHARFCGVKYKLHHHKWVQMIFWLVVGKWHVPFPVLVRFFWPITLKLEKHLHIIVLYFPYLFFVRLSVYYILYSHNSFSLRMKNVMFTSTCVLHALMHPLLKEGHSSTVGQPITV